MTASNPDCPTILIVEDEPLLAPVLEELLMSDGYTVIVARDELEAHRAWAAYRDQIGLLVTDVRLRTAFEGFELAAVLRNDKPSLKVVFITGFPLDDFDNPSLIEGLNFVSKPFQPEVLLHTVRQHMLQLRRR